MAQNPEKVALFGAGVIGREAKIQLPAYGYEVALVVRRGRAETAGGDFIQKLPFDQNADDDLRALHAKEIMQWVIPYCREHGIRYAILAIPSSGDGRVERTYLLELAKARILSATAGKSGFANHFEELAQYLDMFGFDAAVGGGVMIPHFMEEWMMPDNGHPLTVMGVFNGTMNYAQSRAWDPDSTPDQIVQECINEGFAEPSPDGSRLTPIRLYSGEIPDISRKGAIILCRFFRDKIGRYVTPKDLEPANPLTEEALERYMAPNAHVKYLVRITVGRRQPIFDEHASGSICADFGGVKFAAGFCHIDSALARWVPSHVGNAVHIEQGGAPNVTFGPGAGPLATVRTLVRNLRRLKLKHSPAAGVMASFGAGRHHMRPVRTI